MASPADARSGAGGVPVSSGGGITPRWTSATCHKPSAWLAITSSTGVATRRACTSRSASISSGLGSGPPSGGEGGPPSGPEGGPSGGSCSPDGVQRLLTLVSSHVDNREEVG